MNEKELEFALEEIRDRLDKIDILLKNLDARIDLCATTIYKVMSGIEDKK